MTDQPHPGGIGNIGTHTVARVGYGAMQLFEPAPDDATAVLRRAVELGVNHIDTASFYGPGEVNRRIHAALAPYRDDLVIVSKVGARYTGDEPIPLAAAQRPAELRAAVEDDLTPTRRGLCAGGQSAPHGPRAGRARRRRPDRRPRRPVGRDDRAARRGQDRRHRDQQCAAGHPAARTARGHRLRAERLQPARPFPRGDARRLSRPRTSRGCRTSHSGRRSPASRRWPTTTWCVDIAGELDATPAQVGLAWLLAHAPNVLLIAGTKSIGHLEENLGAGDVILSADQIARLDAVTAPGADPLPHGIERFVDQS